MQQIVDAIIEFLVKLIEMLRGLDKGQPPVVTDPPPSTGRTLIWSDEFQEKMDKRWSFFSGRHREAVNTTSHAYIRDGKLRMDCVPYLGQAPRTSYIMTYTTQNLEALNRDDDNLLLDPSQGTLYIEASVNLSRAYDGTQGAWWAFWLFAPNNIRDRATDEKWDSRGPLLDPYDGRADTGMEIDIFEYSPHIPTSPGSQGRRNGFNSAAYISQSSSGGKHPTTPDGHGYFYDINDYIEPGEKVDFTQDRFWKIGFRWSIDKYEFFIDGRKYWEINDPRFITKKRANGIVLSWEIANGLWGETGRTFQQINKSVSVEIDHVKVWRED